MKLTQYTIERSFPVSAERLYQAFVDPADIKVWYWGDFSKDVTVEQDLRIGGTFNIVTDVSGRKGWKIDKAGMRGMYLVIEPGTKLIHTLHWDAPVGYNEPGMNPLDEVIVVNISADGDESNVQYIHMGIPDDGISAPEHERNVRMTMDLLEKHLKA